MKTMLTLGLALLAIAPAQAQVFRPEAVNGAVLGGLAGAIIGNNSGSLHHNAWRGAAIGAGAGLLLGNLVGESNDYRTATQVPIPAAPRTYVYRSAPTYSYYTYNSPSVYSTSVDAEVTEAPGRPNYAASGLFWGALAGAVIGNNSGDLRHNAWRGAAYGATAGYLLGAIAENHARRREAALSRVVTTPTPYVAASAEPANAAPPAPTPAAAPASSMASANSLFGRN